MWEELTIEDKIIISGERFPTTSLKISLSNNKDLFYDMKWDYRFTENCGLIIYKVNPDNTKEEALSVRIKDEFINAIYEVVNYASKDRIGDVKLKTMRGWEIVDKDNNCFVMKRKEKSFKEMFLPKDSSCCIVNDADIPLVDIKVTSNNVNIFAYKWLIDFSLDKNRVLDKRLVLAAVALLVTRL
ncbi:MAG: hypothetical protein ABH858_01800 [Candidatus Omnitrophota bacterium]